MDRPSTAEGSRSRLVAEAGEHLDFEAFFNDEVGRLLRALKMLAGNRHDAEELAQEAFFKVWQRWDRVSAMQNPSAYLYQVALNRFRNRYRSAVRAARRAIALPDPPDPALTVVARDTFREWLAALTPRQRAAVILTELLTFSASDAAEIMGIKVGTVRVLTSQARTALREINADD
jgi:RNA polymerase sigma factor (sigma-70 family)